MAKLKNESWLRNNYVIFLIKQWIPYLSFNQSALFYFSGFIFFVFLVTVFWLTSGHISRLASITVIHCVFHLTFSQLVDRSFVDFLVTNNPYHMGHMKLLNIPFYVLCSNWPKLPLRYLKLENKSSKLSLFDWIKVNDLQVLPRGQINQPQSKLQFSIYCKDWRSHHMRRRLITLRLPWGASKFGSRIGTV